MRGATSLAGLRGSLWEHQIELTLATDPTRTLLWVGDLDAREVPVVADVQRVASIVGHGEKLMAMTWSEGLVSAPLDLRFAIAGADVDLSASTSVSLGAALGQFRIVPGKHVKLHLGREHRDEVFFSDTGVAAGQVTQGRLRSGFQTTSAGLSIECDVMRRVGGVVLSGHVEQSQFLIGGDKQTKSFDGSMDVTIGRWEQLVIFGEGQVQAPHWSFGVHGFAIWVRADYVD